MVKGIAVVGGGITGLATCYYLEKLGRKDITLFESEAIGRETSDQPMRTVL